MIFWTNICQLMEKGISSLKFHANGGADIDQNLFIGKLLVQFQHTKQTTPHPGSEAAVVRDIDSAIANESAPCQRRHRQ